MKTAVFSTRLTRRTHSAAQARPGGPGPGPAAAGAAADESLRRIPFRPRAARRLRRLAWAGAGDLVRHERGSALTSAFPGPGPPVQFKSSQIVAPICRASVPSAGKYRYYILRVGKLQKRQT